MQLDEIGALRFGFAGVVALDRTISYDYDNRMTQVNDNGTVAIFGYDLQGKDYTAKIISVDPSIIKLGNKVEILFTNKKLKHLNGTYSAQDTGSAIKGNHIDLYLGENCDNLAYEYGVQYAYVKY